MVVQRRPFLGAFALAIFVTACLGWLFRGAGKPLAWWLYPVVFGVMACLIYALARLLRPNGARNGHAHAFDGFDELE